MHSFDPNSPGVYNIGILESFIHSLPTEDEQHQSMIYVQNLTRLSDFLDDFCASVALHQHVKTLYQQRLSAGGSHKLDFNRTMHLLKRWDDMAGREAAMTVFHFGQTLQALKSSLKHTPTLAASADSVSLESAVQSFEEVFPDAKIGRHAAGHRGEFSSTLVELRKHGLRGEGKLVFIFPRMEGDEFVATAKGQEARLRIDNANREKLAEITALVFSAFPILDGMLPPINVS